MTWHVLDADRLAGEFASALGSFVPTVGWVPEMMWTGSVRSWDRREVQANPPLTVQRFALQRGYHRFPFSRMLRYGPQMHRQEEASTLVCTTPYYAPVAEGWNGPVVYYLTDLMASYGGANLRKVRSLDRRMCAAAQLVCPNSQRIAKYLKTEAGCHPDKVHVTPNATRLENILPAPLTEAAEVPMALHDLPRPIAGVIGNLAGNMDWALSLAVVKRTPWLSWAFVGPTDMAIVDSAESDARQSLISMGGNVRFTGRQEYGDLRDFARSFDAAILPYMRKEPTYSGSSTRFYEHLAACRPMLSTRGFEELLHKDPLLRLVDTAEQMAEQLESLRASGFTDGQEELRWRTSRDETWHARARSVVDELASRTEGANLAARTFCA